MGRSLGDGEGHLARVRRAWAVSAVTMLLLPVTIPIRSAWAQGGDAAATFDYGLSEMMAGRYATGCPAIEASFRVDPRPGTLFTLADCDRKWGRTASALARFEEYLALFERMPADQKAKQRERAAVAASERTTLERAVPLLTVRLPGDAPAGTRVWRDDVELPAPALGAAVPVDPGAHVVRVQLPDGRSREEHVTLGNGDQRTLVAALAVDAPAPSALATPVASPPPSPPAPPERARADATSHLGWVYVTGGIGVAALAVAGVSGGVALAERGTASMACNAQGVCTTLQGAKAGNEAHDAANVETGALVVGGIAVAAALVLWWTEPRQPARGAKIVWGPAGIGAVW